MSQTSAAYYNPMLGGQTVQRPQPADGQSTVRSEAAFNPLTTGMVNSNKSTMMHQPVAAKKMSSVLFESPLTIRIRCADREDYMTQLRVKMTL